MIRKRKQGKMPPTTMRAMVPIVLAVLATSACDGDTPPPPRAPAAQEVAMAGVCVNPNSVPPNQRVSDDQCGEADEDGDAANSAFAYYWFSTGSSYPIPAYGSTVSVVNGSKKFVPGTKVARNLPGTGVSKLTDVRKYPAYVPAPAAKIPTPIPKVAVPAPNTPPPAKVAPPAKNGIERGGLGSTSGGTKSGTSGGTSSGS